MSYAKGKNFNVVFLPLRYSAGDTYRGSGLVLWSSVHKSGVGFYFIYFLCDERKAFQK